VFHRYPRSEITEPPLKLGPKFLSAEQVVCVCPAVEGVLRTGGDGGSSKRVSCTLRPTRLFQERDKRGQGRQQCLQRIVHATKVTSAASCYLGFCRRKREGWLFKRLSVRT
ncbi:unnamed protein product, partial [Ectocarpus sp. 12 AP-2014]